MQNIGFKALKSEP